MSKEHIHCRRQSPRKQEAPRECITDGSALPGVERRPERGNKNARPGGAREAASAHAASRVRAHVRRPSLCSQAADSEVPLRQRERRDEVGRWAMLLLGLHFYLSRSLFFYLSFRFFLFLFLYLTLSHPLFLSLPLSLSICFSLFLSVCPTVSISLNLSVCVFICLYICVYVSVSNIFPSKPLSRKDKPCITHTKGRYSSESTPARKVFAREILPAN